MLYRVMMLFIVFVVCFGMLGTARAQDSKTDDAIVSLSYDPAFRDSYRRFFKMVDAIDKGLSKMTEKDRQKLVADLRAFKKNRGSPARKVGHKLGMRVKAISGITDNDMAKTFTIGKGLVARHPILLKGPAAAGQAAQFARMEYNFHTIAPDKECNSTCTCLRNCKEERRNALNEAGLSAYADALMSPSLVNFVLLVIGLPVEASRIYDAEVECEKTCMDFGPGFDCQSDSDCELGEFCQNNWGNPVNSCQRKRELGRACSADRKCQSGCCKFHFWTNPMQMVCRPADKCD